MDAYSQNILLSAGKFSEEKNYWLDKLSGDFRWGSLPVDSVDFRGQAKKAGPSPPSAVCKREIVEVTIPANSSREIVHIVNRSPHGLYIFLLAGTAILLHRYSPSNAYTYSHGEETDLVLGMPAFQQTGSPAAGIQAIRISIDNHTRFKDLLLQLKDTVTQARKFCHIPFLKIAQWLNLVPPDSENGNGSERENGSESEYTLFKTVVLLENIHDYNHNKQTDIETVFSFLWQGQESHQAEAEQIQLRLAYDPGLYAHQKIKQICRHLVNILGNAAANPGTTTGEIELLSPEEKQQLLLQCNGVQSSFPAACIYPLFAGQVDRNPDYTIAVGPSVGKNVVKYASPVQLSNRELANRSNHMARELKVKGVAKGSIVGVMVEPCLEMVPAIMGILKAGCVFLPIEPATPPERVKYILNDGNVNILLTRPQLADTLPAKTGIINLEEFEEIEEIGEIQTAEPIETNQSSAFDPVYVIYTSGTTGKPKGVLIHSSNLVNYVYWFSQIIGLSPADRAILTSSFAFDALYTQFFSSMLVGCQLHVVARDTFLTAELLINYLQTHRITYIKNTPSLFNIVVNSPGFSKEKLKKLRFVMLGGEEINVKDVEKAHQLCPHLRVMNHYGPTETTIGSIARFIDFENAAGYNAYEA
ncbi:MAG: AMP-binding protein, partial [Acidobacteria bacterium]|nr:AMP-binding protein [Acidobacteriota bacterium]